MQYLAATRPSDIPGYLDATARQPDWHPSGLIVAARAMLAAGRDEDARRLAESAAGAWPHLPQPQLILADLASFTGSATQAFDHARSAWLIAPAWADAGDRAIRLAYPVVDEGEADALALTAMEQFPHDNRILSAACHYCFSEAQFHRIHELWQGQVTLPQHISSAVRPLTMAALHLGLHDTATALLAEACLVELAGNGVGQPIRETHLAGQSSGSVLRDLQEAMQASGIPYFFAAGTALGIVRDGRPLDHDHDIDVGVFEADWHTEQLTSAFRNHARFCLEPVKTDSKRLRLTHRNGADLDIFPFYRESEHVYHDGKFLRWRNTPFDIQQYETGKGEKLPVPDNVEQYLTENYGDWRTPDPDFDAFVHGANTEVAEHGCLHAHRMWRAYRYIRAMDLPRARAEVAAARDGLAHLEQGRQLMAEVQL